MKTRSWWLVIPCALAGCGESEVERPAPEPPPSWGVPISGGNLLITRDGARAVIADPDRDRLVTVELASGEPQEIALEKGDEPGRLVEDGAGRVHVALRRGGALITLDAALSRVETRRQACGEPRGLVWDAARDSLHVACAGGELVSLPAAGGAISRTLRLERDLRDVMVQGDQLVVTKFRSAELLTVDAAGAVMTRQLSPVTKRLSLGKLGGGGFPEPAPPNSDFTFDAKAAVAWRTVAMPSGGYLMSHQRTVKAPVSTAPGGYDGGCGDGPAEAALTVVEPGRAPVAVRSLLRGGLPVDLAVSSDSDLIAVALAGNDTVTVMNATALGRPDDEPCPPKFPQPEPGEIIILLREGLGAPTSVAWTPDKRLVVYYPEYPAMLLASGPSLETRRVIELPGELGYDSGRTMFHAQTASGLSCASCHPEGREDGQVWEFQGFGPRRTQSLAGDLLERAPFHWEGDMMNLEELMHDVFEGRMSGSVLTDSQKKSIGPWLARIPAPKPMVVADTTSVERGKALFDSPTVGCASCHSGPLYTNNVRVAVGTEGTFKVPSLKGVASRAPFMHDGCAATLRDRFGACGGGDRHGATSQLSPAQLDDLVSYLETL